jgi:hypothetical protein
MARTVTLSPLVVAISASRNISAGVSLIVRVGCTGDAAAGKAAAPGREDAASRRAIDNMAVG